MDGEAFAPFCCYCGAKSMLMGVSGNVGMQASLSLDSSYVDRNPGISDGWACLNFLLD